MGDTEPTKVCPFCAEAIKAAAKVCPYCRSWQKKWSLKNPANTAVLYAAIWMAMMIGFGIFFDNMFGPKKQFATYRNEIRVMDSHFSQRTVSSNHWLTVVGTLTNTSDVGWKNIGVEARFFDQAGTMIDAISVNANDYNGVAILPHGDAAFKIEGRAAHQAEDYYTNELNVRWAKDIDQMFP